MPNNCASVTTAMTSSPVATSVSMREKPSSGTRELRTARGRATRLPQRAWRDSDVGERKRQLHGGTAGGRFLHGDAPVMHHHDFLNDGQAQTGAAGAGREERL